MHRVEDEKTGLPALQFQHPTLAGPGQFGGWFEEDVAKNGPKGSSAAEPMMPTPPPPPAEKAAPPPPELGHPLDAASPITLKKGFITLPLASRTEISHDTRVFRFSLPTPEHELGLPVGQHLFIKAKSASGESVMRAYTPMGCGKGYVDFVIKVRCPSPAELLPNSSESPPIASSDCMQAPLCQGASEAF